MSTRISYPAVALDFMNRDHADFVALLDRLDAGLAGAATEDIGGLLDELLDHTSRHFAAEEAAMQEAGFPAYPIHRGEHGRVLVMLTDRIGQWRTDRDDGALRAWLCGEATDWFTGHVASMDTVTAGFIAARGGRR